MYWPARPAAAISTSSAQIRRRPQLDGRFPEYKCSGSSSRSCSRSSWALAAVRERLRPDRGRSSGSGSSASSLTVLRGGSSCSSSSAGVERSGGSSSMSSVPRDIDGSVRCLAAEGFAGSGSSSGTLARSSGGSLNRLAAHLSSSALTAFRALRLGVLNLAAFQLGQLFVQVQVVQVQLLGCPLLLADCPGRLGGVFRCGWLFRLWRMRVGALLQQLARGVEHL